MKHIRDLIPRKDLQEYLMCLSKKQYPSKAFANKVARRIHRKHKIRAYLCPYCLQWHLTKRR